jgi:hypothetical protein
MIQNISIIVVKVLDIDHRRVNKILENQEMKNLCFKKKKTQALQLFLTVLKVLSLSLWLKL